MRVFVTGASGHIGSAVISELITAGHKVVGLARSDASAAAVSALGADVRRGDLDDLDGLKEAAADSDGVIHLAFKHDLMLTGQMGAAITTELAVVHALGDALAGTGRPLVTASGTGLAGRHGDLPGTEEDAAAPSKPEDAGTPRARADSEVAVIGLASRGVRSSIVRIPPITHSELDRHGFAVRLIALAQEKGLAGYPGDGANRWAAVHTLDLVRLFRLALENAPAGTQWHGVGDPGVPMREIAASIGEHLGVPTESIPLDQLPDYYGPFLATIIAADLPSTNLLTRRDLSWDPTHPDLLTDFAKGHYFPAGA